MLNVAGVASVSIIVEKISAENVVGVVFVNIIVKKISAENVVGVVSVHTISEENVVKSAMPVNTSVVNVI